MPAWWPQLGLFVFVTHMPFFAWRWVKTGELRYGATTLTFALLTVTYAIRVFAPELRLGGAEGFALWQWVRVPAWIAAAASLTLLARHRLTGRA